MYRVAFVCAVFVFVGIVFIYLVADYRSKLRPECNARHEAGGVWSPLKMSPFIVWLDQNIGPPWSGLVVLAMVGSLSAFSAYVSVRTIHHIYRDKP